MTTRCKFYCDSVTKQIYWHSRDKFVFTASFQPVTDGSEEDKKFWAATPSGKLEVGCVSQDIFVPGAEYYVDITLAPE